MTNADGSQNKDYCKFCFTNGIFNQDMTLDEYIECSLQFVKEAGMTEEEMRTYCKFVIPTLKRWK